MDVSNDDDLSLSNFFFSQDCMYLAWQFIAYIMVAPFEGKLHFLGPHTVQ